MLLLGPKVRELEETFKEYVGCKHAITMNSCTAGMELALRILGIKEGDEVITSPLTFPASANVIEHVGAKPVFVDVEKETGNMDVTQLKEKITDRTKAIIPVHLFGMPCDMDPILEIAQKNLALLLDAFASMK